MKIYNLGTPFYNNYLISTDAGCILIDCGNKISYAEFLKKLGKFGIEKHNIKHLVLTHVHADHLSYLKNILDDIHPTIYVGKTACEKLMLGHDEYLGYSGALSKLIVSASIKSRGVASWEPFDLGKYSPVIVTKNTYIEGFDAAIIPLPGHTEDSIGLAKKEGIFFTGDAIMSCLPARHLIPPMIYSEQDFKNSYNELINSGASMFYTGHGSPVTKNRLLDCKIYTTNLRLHR